MNRRGFLGFLGLGGAAAATVKQSVTLPDEQDAVENFAGGALMQPAPVEIRTGRQKSPWGGGDWYDIQDGILYDRIRFAPGTTIPPFVRFFATPIGQVCPYTNVVKTYRHTNLYQAATLPAPRQFLARRIIFAAHPTALVADLDTLSGEAYWRFQLLCKYMADGPLLLNGPGRAGLRDIVGMSGAPKDPLPEEVIATSRDCSTLGGVMIPSQFSFGVEIQTPDRLVILKPASEGGRGIDLLIGFVGLDARAVQ